MSRCARCGYGVSRSSRSSCSSSFYQGLLRGMLALAVLVGVGLYVTAQDVNVHIEPRPTPDAAAAAGANKQPEAKAADVVDDPGLKVNHGKPIKMDVDLVLVPVTVTDDWNRIV